MKKIILLLSISIMMLLCCSCGLIGDQEYVCDIDEVEDKLTYETSKEMFKKVKDKILNSIE